MTRALVFLVSFWITTACFITPAFGLESEAVTARKSILQATAHFKNKEYAKVTPLLWKHIDLLSPNEFHILMKSHAYLEQADDLLRVSGLLISRSDKDFEAYHYQGRALLMKKKDKEALESFKKALNINSKHLPTYMALAQYYEDKKNLYEQRVVYQDMLTAFGPRGEILTKLCKVHTEDGLNETGEKYCKQATQKDHKVPDNHVNLGIIQIQIGDRAKGKELLKRAAGQFPNSEIALYNYAKVLEEDKNFIDSYKTYKRCSQIDPKSERCILGYANSAFEIQKFQEAHDNYKKLCRINRTNSVHARRGLVSLRTTGPKEWSQKFQELSDFCSM
jgi:tetratricopeptide (TPR) repeat protein